MIPFGVIALIPCIGRSTVVKRIVECAHERATQERRLMIRLDFDVACRMAREALPEGWVIEIHLEKGVCLLGLFPPNGARQDFSRGDTTAEQLLKALSAAKNAKIVFPETQPGSRMGFRKKSRVKLCAGRSKMGWRRPSPAATA
jgi:hypothetical protein